MKPLKGYQTRSLDALRDFFKQCSRDGRPEDAFGAVQLKNGVSSPAPYLPVKAEGLAPGTPYVCLRIPTGGGKTLVACHAVGKAMTEFLHADKAVILWLVPSTTILEQTANALRDEKHDYRRALELSCGSVEVVTVDEALGLSRASVDGQTVVVVATIQAFRVEQTADRRVYSEAGALMDHFTSLPANRLIDLHKGPDGKPIPSLVNVLRLHRPIVIVDEAHNARTDLSFEMLGNISPSCIIEFTATPARAGHPSNVLHHVSAAELKGEDMVKLPLRVVTRHPSQRDQLLGEAVKLRGDLEKLAVAEGQQTGEYLRPILLIQAPSVDDCEPLREKLVAEYGPSFGVTKDQIKISVGRINDLDAAGNLLSPKCPVRFIITVEKLREGWDCPFAYVLCSLKETRAATAMEQIVGRVLRLPNVRLKQHPDLNVSYAFSVSSSIGEVLAELRDALEKNGFTPGETERLVVPGIQTPLPFGVQPQIIKVTPTEIDNKAAENQIAALAGKVRIDARKGEIAVVVPLDDHEKEQLKSCVKTAAAKEQIEQAVIRAREIDQAFGGTGKTRLASPYEQQLEFKVPVLCVKEGDDLLEFDSTFLIEHPWKLSTKDAALSIGYDPRQRPAGQAGMLDVSSTTGKVEANILAADKANDFVATLHQQVLALGMSDEWDMERLVVWLDKKIDHQDIIAGEMAEFLRKVVRGLMTKHGIEDTGTLALDRFRLRDEVDRRIQEHRESERLAAFQTFLLDESPLVVTDEKAIDFSKIVYDPSRSYDGAFQFKKHYFPKPGDLVEKTASGELTEEFKCALFLDDLPETRYWVRNLARRPTSFRLQTSKDWFYPDFLVQLNDGRVLVVEYKGAHLLADAEEKKLIGALWESRSNGRGLFAMPTKSDFSVITSKIGSGAQKPVAAETRSRRK